MNFWLSSVDVLLKGVVNISLVNDKGIWSRFYLY